MNTDLSCTGEVRPVRAGDLKSPSVGDSRTNGLEQGRRNAAVGAVEEAVRVRERGGEGIRTGRGCGLPSRQAPLTQKIVSGTFRVSPSRSGTSFDWPFKICFTLISEVSALPSVFRRMILTLAKSPTRLAPPAAASASKTVAPVGNTQRAGRLTAPRTFMVIGLTMDGAGAWAEAWIEVKARSSKVAKKDFNFIF